MENLEIGLVKLENCEIRLRLANIGKCGIEFGKFQISKWSAAICLVVSVGAQNLKVKCGRGGAIHMYTHLYIYRCIYLSFSFCMFVDVYDFFTCVCFLLGICHHLVIFLAP